jgi:hypothetical protein
MKILTFNKDDSKPANISEKTLKIGKLIEYWVNTKDETLVNVPEIDRIEIYDTIFLKIYFSDKSMVVFYYSDIEWLKTHHYMYRAKQCKEEAEKLYDLIHDKFDWFIVEDWYIKNRTNYGINLAYLKDKEPEITYDKDFIYVKGKNTHLKTSSELIQFVSNNAKNWY